MAITLITSGAVATSGNQTTGFTLTIPSGTQAGDIIIVAVTNRNATANPSVADNDAGGNTYQAILARNNGTANASAWWKRATSGTASKTLTISGCTGSASGGMAVYRGCSIGAAPYEGATGETNASGNVTHAAITPTRNGSLVCLDVHNATNDLASAGQAATSPATLTERFDSLSTGGSDCQCSHASAVQTTAGTTGSVGWTQTAAASQSIVFDIMAALDAVNASPNQTFSLTGIAANLIRALQLNATPNQTFAFTGNAANLVHGYAMVAEPTSFMLTGNAAGLTRACQLSASPQQTFTLAGIDAALRAGRTITSEQAQFLLAGIDTVLIYTPSEGATLTAEAGAFTMTGNDIECLYTLAPVVDSGGGSLGKKRVNLELARHLYDRNVRAAKILREDEEILMIVVNLLITELAA